MRAVGRETERWEGFYGCTRPLRPGQYAKVGIWGLNEGADVGGGVWGADVGVGAKL